MNEEMQNKSTDKGWVAMRTLLDQEMPVQQKRRAVIWWLFALLLLPLVAIGTGYLWNYTAKGDQPIPRPIESTAVPFAATSGSINKENTVNSDTETSSLQGKESHQAPGKFRDEIVPANANQVEQHTTPILKNTAGQPGLTLKNSFPIEIVKSDNDLDPATKNTDLEPILPIQALSDVSAAFGRQASLDFLPVQPVLAIIKPRAIIAPTIMILNPELGKFKAQKPRSATWRLAGSAMVSTESFSLINGFEMGVTAHWQALRRWGLRSGLYYGSYRLSSNNRIAAVVRPGQYASAVDMGYELLDGAGNIAPSSAAFSTPEQVVIPVSKLKILEAPILATWEPARSLTLFAGLNTAFVTAAKTNNESYVGDFTLTLNSNADARNLNALAVNEIQRWRFDFQTGFGVKVGRQLELGMFARFPLDNESVVSTNKANGLSGPISQSYNVLKRRSPAFSAYVHYFFMDFR